MLSPDANASSHRRRPSTKIESGSFPSRTARARRSRELSRLVIILDFTLEQFATETQRHGANLQAQQKRRGLLTNPAFALCVSVSLWLHSSMAISAQIVQCSETFKGLTTPQCFTLRPRMNVHSASK